MSGLALAQAAEALVGAPFRLHGRDPATGLDCLGLIAAALTAIGRPAPLPNGYALRRSSLPTLAGFAAACGFAETAAPVQPGDVLLLRAGPGQFHFAVAARGEGYVHAHAGLGRVARGEAPLPWPVLTRWRLIED